MIKKEKKRIGFIDVAKFIGIFAIYLGHLNDQLSKEFVFAFHVPLFFLISGCMENLNKEEKFSKFLFKKIKSILIPFFIFSILSLIINVIDNNTPIKDVIHLIRLILCGNIRGSSVASSLWFLSCLFVMEILFFIIKKIKIKPVIFSICLVLFIIVNTLIKPSPVIHPHFIYNVDSALYYIIYYAIGYISFPYIQKLFNLDKLKYKIVFAITGIIALIYSIFLFLGKNYLEVFRYILPSFLYDIVVPIMTALIVIWLVLIISKMFEDNRLLYSIGKETLYLCGGEYIIKTLVQSLIIMIGLSINLSTPLTNYLYALLTILLCYKFLVPIEKYLVLKTQTIFSKEKVSVSK